MQKLSTFVFFSLLAGTAFAEGNCPAGMYPIGGPGAMGCAPIPTAQEAPAQQPSTIWVGRWGALAADIGVVGTSTQFSDERSAAQAALQRCNERGGKKCKIVATYVNSCIAAAIPIRNGKPDGRFATQIGPDLEAIKTSVVEFCSKNNGTECVVAYTDCAKL